MSKWIRTGDEVVAIAGNDKGKVGKVLARGEKWVVVEGFNKCKKAIKKSQENQQGGFVSFERPMNISNVALSVDGKPTKVKVKMGKDNSKELVYTAAGKTKVHRKVKA